MKKNYWFKGKRYGWGWYPASKEGWLVLFVFVVLEMLLAFYTSVTVFIIGTIILLPGLIYICYKTGEKPRWRWGK